MRRHFLFLVASTLTLRDALAAPGGTPQIAQCTLKFDDPTTWDKSNASTYLNVFLKEHGTSTFNSYNGPSFMRSLLLVALTKRAQKTG